MQHSTSSEANQFSDSQEIPHILWNLNVHYRIHKCLQPVSILSQLDPVHHVPFALLKSYWCHLQHKPIGFYNRDEKCSQCGTDWSFK